MEKGIAKTEVERAMEYAKKHLNISNPRGLQRDDMKSIVDTLNRGIANVVGDALKSLERIRKCEYLQSLGCDIEDSSDTWVYFELAGEGSYKIDFIDFAMSDTIGQITDASELLSMCCGATMDKDTRICPRCKEHS